MDFRHLRYFVAVAEEGTFTRAARRLYIAQPALSKQIQDLEEEIGTRLLVRSARGAALTAPGAELLEHARAIIEREARARERIRGLAGAPEVSRAGGSVLPFRPPLEGARGRASKAASERPRAVA
jgi:DNA-binding transcriptional LysR family regulator